MLAAQKHTEVMRLLRKPMPVTFLGQFLFFCVQFIRAVLNLLVVGLWLERMLVYCLARHEVVKTEAKAFMFGCRCGEGQASSGLQWSFLRYYGYGFSHRRRENTTSF